MRRLFIVLLFLTASVWLGLAVIQHPGYVFISTQPWTVQMPLWFAFLALLILFGLFFIIVDSIDSAQFLWYRIKNWFHRRREQKSYSKTQHGLSFLIEGSWSKAEKLLIQGAEQAGEPLINYLAAAQAAQKQEAFDRRDRYLRRAYQEAPQAELAIGLAQAQLQLENKELEQAAATLNRLRQTHPKHPKLMLLLQTAYMQLGDWENLYALLTNIRKSKALTDEQYTQLECKVSSELLKIAGMHDQEKLKKAWNDLSRAMRREPQVVLAYVKQLISFGDDETAKDLIVKTLKTTWSPELVTIYSGLEFENLNRQLVIGADWLKAYGSQPEALLFLGKICMKVQLWGKARDYFERCLAQGPNAEAMLEYGKLLTQLNEGDQAVAKYRDTLTQMAD